MSVKQYRKKPVTIEAIQWTGENFRQITEFMNYFGDVPASDKLMQTGQEFASRVGLAIHTLEGDLLATVGDFIIKGVNGEFYHCKPDIFEKTYEEVEPVCPKCGDDLEACDGCGRKGCTSCEEGWTTDSGDNRLCPDCAQTVKEEWARDTDNGKKVCETCRDFVGEVDDEDFGTCSNAYSDHALDCVNAKNYCPQWCQQDTPPQNETPTDETN